MRKRSARTLHHSSTYGLALFIGALILLLVVASVAIKIFLLFQSSIYDGKHQLSVEVVEPFQTQFIVFNPRDNNIHTLTIHGQLPTNPERMLGIPIDAVVKSKEAYAMPADFAQALILKKGQVSTNATIIDGVNLFIFSHTADTDDAVSKDIAVDADVTTQDTIFSKIFLDETLYKEGESIAIINASGVSGLGSEVGRLLTHLGGDVVSITTAQDESKTSSLAYVADNSYTLTRLSKLFHISPTHLSTPSVSDITIVLGEDFK